MIRKYFLTVIISLPILVNGQNIVGSDFQGNWYVRKAVRTQNNLPKQTGEHVDNLIRKFQGSKWFFDKDGSGSVIFMMDNLNPEEIKVHFSWEFHEPKQKLILEIYDQDLSELKFSVKSYKRLTQPRAKLTSHRFYFDDVPLFMELRGVYPSRSL